MNTPNLRALTLHPEWAWAILNLGKDVENRPPSVAKMVLNVIGDGWLAIHAGKSMWGKGTKEGDYEGMVGVYYAARNAGWRCEWGHHGHPHTLQLKRGGEHLLLTPHTPMRSAIVALTRVGPGNRTSRWAVPGQAQIGLRDLFVLPEPVPCSGKQGLWTVADEVAVKVFAQVTT